MTVSQLMSITKVAKHLDCSRAHAYRLVAAGALRSVEIHEPTSKRPKTRVYAEDLQAYIEAQTTTLPRKGVVAE